MDSPRSRSGRSLARALVLLLAGATVASLVFVATGWGRASATAHGFTACKDSRGYLFIPPSECRDGTQVSWDGDIPAVAAGAKSLTKDAVVRISNHHTFGNTIKDPGGWKRTKSYVAKCPLDYVAVAGAFNVDWAYVWDAKVVASWPRTIEGASAWEVRAVRSGPSDKAPNAIVNVDAICIRRTAIFPTG